MPKGIPLPNALRTPKGYISRATMTDEERKLKRVEARNKNPAMSRKNIPMPESTRITATLNWKRRCILGVMAQTRAHSLYWIFRSKTFGDLSPERQKHLEELNQQLIVADKLLKEIVDHIGKLKNLPKWSPEGLPKHKKPYRKHQKV
jgi:hypothetical protein